MEEHHANHFTIERLPKDLQATFRTLYSNGRQFIGIELQEKYVALARRAIDRGVQIKLLAESDSDIYADRPAST